ncbi:hypothetical protein UFOVP1367_16 [uncultured Caudovirales phage]|uniref:Uncharacterized protein n=1 Tax=uncultured Caudovirales phage TaxID=2100421 RepID=A0A6J5RVP7_9CAUD|nr:hypothetical protein KNT69_gp16 [uncultured Caudovirales phage]CAB4202450.1 hypothetical protein UFOVP1367_16 [uncultured Caudovirales phage]
METSELLEQMQVTIHAINGIKDLLSIDNGSSTVNACGLYFLLDIICEKQEALITKLFTNL